jgi:chemotaxis protein CheD
MLPDNRNRDGQWSHDGIGAATRYGTFAMEHVINKILEHGGKRENLEVKVVGGGQILRGASEIGKQNIAFVRQYLQAEGLPIINEDLGDIYPRKVRYYPATGRLQVKRLKSLNNDTIVERERSYKNELEHQPPAGEIDVFKT